MYKLAGRGITHYLRKLKPEDNCKSYTLDTSLSYRVGLIDDELFIDPSGGPLMTKGTVLEGIGTISKVDFIEKKGCVITFE